jgi:Class III cytochrome C family
MNQRPRQGQSESSFTIRGPSAVGISISLCLVLFHCLGQSLGQRRTSPKPTQNRSSSAGRIDYSKFLHATTKHKQPCNTCHKTPTSNWQKVRGYPDIADYPDHDACVGCHRSQFFKGARPVICTVCHVKVSPRDDARFPFRKPDGLRQFLIQFPHDKHQDVIARLLWHDKVEGNVRFAKASFISRISTEDDKAKTYNNCTICHLASTKTPVAPAEGWPDKFVPSAATFKSSPNSHASCFNCHWKSQQPIKDNCAGCHQLAEKGFVAVEAPNRISIKFRHDREQHIAECTACHINITKAASLRGLKPDVPITSCTECHNKDGLRTDVNNELEALDKNRGFVCVYCHASSVGRKDAPASHYLIAGREPLMRKDLK